MKANLDFSFDRAVHGEELFGGTGKLGRATWLAKRVREDDIYFMQDGTLSQLLFIEVLESFISGQYIATIILGFSLIERTIAGRLNFVGNRVAATGSSEGLIDAALQKEWLTEEEHGQLHELRQLRNPIVHFRDHLAESRPEVRAALLARTTAQILEADAKRILEATIHVLNKTAL